MTGDEENNQINNNEVRLVHSTSKFGSSPVFKTSLRLRSSLGVVQRWLYGILNILLCLMISVIGK